MDRKTPFKGENKCESSGRFDSNGLETSAFEFLYGGQLRVSTKLINPSFLIKTIFVS